MTFDFRIVKIEDEKQKRYSPIKFEVGRVRCMRRVKVVLIIIGLLEIISKDIGK